MKITTKILSLTVLIALTLFYAGCDDDKKPQKDEKDVQIELLNGTWAVTSATLDGAPPSLDHSSMTIAVTGTAGSPSVSYTVNNRPAGPSPWPASGTLTFGDNVKQQLVREDNVEIMYSVTESSLVFDFTFSGTPYTAGRTTNVSGNWHFEFQKQ